MLFNSLIFVLLFPVAVLLINVLPRRFRWMILLAASLLFYVIGNPAIDSIVLCCISMVAYGFGMSISRLSALAKRLVLYVSICIVFSVVICFKYPWAFGVIKQIVQHVSPEVIGAQISFPSFPLGLSFYSLQAIRYLVEIYRGNIEPEYHFGMLALYLSFFPFVAAGPLERPSELMKQFRFGAEITNEACVDGSIRILFGFFKKLVVADRLAIPIAMVFGRVAHFTGMEYSLAAIMFSVQIYCDYSGYCDIALGSARVMGITLTENFTAPFASSSLKEFWQRWNITLSIWLRDYIYIPLGGNRRGSARHFINIVFTFIFSGIWHGVGLTFVVWGTLHGLLLAFSQSLKDLCNNIHSNVLKVKGSFIADGACRIGTFCIVTFLWIFFRAHSYNDVMVIMKRFPLGWGNGKQVFEKLQSIGLDSLDCVIILLACLVVFLGDYFVVSGYLRIIPVRWRLFFRFCFAYSLVVGIVIFGKITSQKFIYFQF